MGLVLVGVNHKTASVKTRESFSLTQKQLKEALNELKQINLLLGTTILSTCNRMEIYAHLADNNSDLQKIKRFLLNRYQVSQDDIRRYFYILEDIDAVRHIFRVASGLDSQVLGETQILGQVKSAWIIAKDIGVIGVLLGELFEKAVDVGRTVRLDTKISQGNISIGSVAIKMLEQKFTLPPTLSAAKSQSWCGGLQNKLVLIIGAGKIGALISKYLQQKGIKGIFVSNRTYARAYALASNCGGEAINFSQLKERLKTVDIVISSTASPHLILRKETLAEVMQAREKPLLIMDLALPRDVDPEARNIPNIFLYDLDDLKSVIEENYNKRRKEANLAEKIIQRELKTFSRDINGLRGEDEGDKKSNHWFSREQISFSPDRVGKESTSADYTRD